MRTYIINIFITLFVFTGSLVRAQDVPLRLEQAKAAYSSGNLQDSRLALQQALAEVDQALGKEILSMLPQYMESLSYVEEEDLVMGNAAGITGMHVNRFYGDDQQSVRVELIDDSPLLAAVNSLLSLPTFMGAADPNQKRIRIHGYKALMEKSTDDSTGVVSWNLQVPFNRSLFTFQSIGFEEEKKVVGMAETIPLEAIIKLTK